MIEILSKKLLEYYDKNKRDLPWRNNPNPYRIWVSEIMLQQTRVSTVIPYYENFLHALPRVEDLARADEELLHKLWEGLGYYSRVRNMKKAAQQILEDHQGRLPESYEGLIQLQGIGPYTAGAIASIAFNKVVPAIDGNLLRIYSRLHCIEESIDLGKVKKEVFALVLEDISKDRPGDFNQALMDVGSSICLPKNPKCHICPIEEFCQAYKENRQRDFPLRKAKTIQKKENWTFIILEKRGKFLIQKRPPQGLLAGLWEFLPFSSHLKEKDVKILIEEKGYTLKTIKKLDSSQHVFSHKIWNMKAY
ncbi:MAG: A/G-specific adenine glycosylase, partial [Tissierellia bacterium]|nr:A/G-specific adenine glycosylase [Tissierellia bacterium]